MLMGLNSPHPPAPAASLYPHAHTHIPARFVHKNIHTFPIFLSIFFWAGVYRDPEEAAAVMETAGAETLSVFPSEIPPGAVRLSAAEEVCGISGGEGWMQWPEQEHSKWEQCVSEGGVGSAGFRATFREGGGLEKLQQ